MDMNLSKLQCHLMQRTNSLEKTLMLGKIEGRRKRGDRGWDGWMASPTGCTWVCVNSGCWWWTGRPGVLQFTGSQRVGHDWVTELNWTELSGKTSKWNSPGIETILKTMRWEKFGFQADREAADQQANKVENLGKALSYMVNRVSIRMQDYSVRKGQSFQQYTLGKVDIHMEKNILHTRHKNELKIV